MSGFHYLGLFQVLGVFHTLTQLTEPVYHWLEVVGLRLACGSYVVYREINAV